MTSTPVVYDKASYHIEGNLPSDLPERQAYVHPGFFLGWLVERDLVSEEVTQQFADELELFRRGRLSPADLFAKLGGALAADMLSDEANRFAVAYYDDYVRDYEKTLASRLASPYHVEDNRENYESMRARIDAAFERWRASRFSAI